MRIKTAFLNRIFAILMLLVLIWANNNCFAMQNIRDVDDNPVSMKNDINYGDNLRYQVDYLKRFSPYSEKTATLKGGVSHLISLVNRSQLVRFDEPVKRISIANPALADIVLLSKQEILINGKASGTTSLIIWGEKGRDPVFFDLIVKNDTTAFLEALKSIAPNEKNVDIKFSDVTTAESTTGTTSGGDAGNSSSSSSTTKNVIFSGKLSSSITKEKIKSLAAAYGFSFVDLTESSTPQVILEVKIVEASRELTRNLVNDVNGSIDLSHAKLTPNPFKKTNLSFSTTQAIPQITFNTIRMPILNSSSDISFSETKGLVKILAEPKLVALNKQKATFNAGKQIPVPTGIDPESGLINYEYKDVGVNLEFTPEILEESGKVILKLIPEVSEIDPTTTVNQGNGILIYGMRTRKTDTTVELNNGETLVIAGLIQRNDSVSSDQVPLLGDIPIIGNLFASKEWRKGQTELLIFVTPKIINSGKMVNGV